MHTDSPRYRVKSLGFQPSIRPMPPLRLKSKPQHSYSSSRFGVEPSPYPVSAILRSVALRSCLTSGNRSGIGPSSAAALSICFSLSPRSLSLSRSRRVARRFAGEAFIEPKEPRGEIGDRTLL